MVLRSAVALLIALVAAGWVAAAEISIHVSGLFKNTAILVIDGQQHILKAGQTSPHGIKLISANSRQALIEYRGQQEVLKMGSSGALGFHDPDVMVVVTPVDEQKPLRLVRDRDGMFRARGIINSTQVHFLVDTGATVVSMNRATAERMGLAYQVVGQPMKVETASGITDAYRVVLARVRIGELELNNVEGTVIDGEQPSIVLLGNSFLGKFKVEQDGDHLTISVRKPSGNDR
ncbi:MAG: TIGR02281 family clan AA aspartic protease [Gammaproteobacteria bacterium]|nr:TIGR02281 family clan AA aspartic protease [Gammaproteobacteria bacterium]